MSENSDIEKDSTVDKMNSVSRASEEEALEDADNAVEEANEEAEDVLDDGSEVSSDDMLADLSEEEIEPEKNDLDLETAVIYARPPFNRAELETEAQQMDVQDSPAFQCLEIMFSEGKLTGTEVAQYKAKSMLLHDYLKKSRENEFHLLQQSKRYTLELEKQSVEMHRADEFPDNITTEVGRLREQLLRSHNTITQTEERVDALQYKIGTLTEEKKLLEREYARMPKLEEIEKRRKALTEGNKELQIDIEKQKRETKKLKEQLRELEDLEKAIMPQHEEQMKGEDALKAELVVVISKPGQISKEAEKFRKEKVELENSLKTVLPEVKGIRQEVEKYNKQLMSLEQQAAEIRILQAKQQEEFAMAQEGLDEINKKYEYAKDLEVTHLTDKTTLDMNFRHFQLEKKNLHEVHTNRLYEKDRELRRLKKAKSQLKVQEENLVLTKQVLARNKERYETVPRDDGSLAEEKKKISAELAQMKRAFAQQNSLTAVEQVKVQQAINDEKVLTRELEERHVEYVELSRMAAIKADEREQKARDFMRADVRYHRTVEDLKVKELQINEHRKKNLEMEVKLTDFAKLFEVIKADRNKCVNLLQTTTQKALEMREKIRILQNEIEILHTTSQQREKQLQKQRMRHANAIVARDTLRGDVSRQNFMDQEQAEVRDQLRLDIQRLNLAMNQLEENMVQLRKQKERAVQMRNDRAVQLIERNEEVCILQEKVRVQASVIQRGEIELQSREEEIAALKRILNELKRSVALLKKQMPQKKAVEAELTTAQIQLSICQDRLLELEKQAENPQKHNRLRLLEGEEPSPVGLQQQLEKLETRLAKKEEQLLEKELLMDAVTRLLEQVKKKAVSGKEDTLQLAKDVNGYKARMSHVTKKMKATTAELTMYMTEALRLEQEVRDKEHRLEMYYRNLEKGEPPSPEIEIEWEKLMEQERQAEKERARAREMAQEEGQFTLPTGAVTTAEPRPNAYLPDDEEALPLPRPYGVHAPFRPTEPGSNMRHIRKPKIKPIEI